MTVKLTHLPTTGVSVPFGASHLPAEGVGASLDAIGYGEEEYLLSGTADLYRHDEALRPVLAREAVVFATRVMIRAPRDATRFSGVVHAEPLHPDLDGGLSWRALAPALVRCGHAWVGMTAFAGVARLMRETIDPGRYGELSLAEDGVAYDAFARMLALLRSPRTAGTVPAPFGGRPVRQVFVSGWSATSSFCRVLLNEGFHRRAPGPDGEACVDGALLAISSGARSFGYPPLSGGSPPIPTGHPHRIVAPVGVPVIEMLSEFEVEANASTWRPDADAPEDRYRQYQVAGTFHSAGEPSDATAVAARQLQLAGLQPPRAEIRECPSDARLDYVARAVLAHLEAWARDGVAPPRAEPLRRLADRAGGPVGLAPEALPLERDIHGNAVGGVRTVWVQAPAATYLPHSTADPEACRASPFAPIAGLAAQGDIIGHRRPFSLDAMRELYGDAGGYRAAVADSATQLTADGWLCAPDAESLIGQLGDRWPPEPPREERLAAARGPMADHGG